MANPNRQGNPNYRRTQQELQNSSFDEAFQVSAVELLAYNASTNTLDRVQINNDGGVLTANGLVNGNYDYISYTNTSSTVDTYVYKTGGSSGSTIATVTITYTDTTKNQVSTVAKT